MKLLAIESSTNCASVGLRIDQSMKTIEQPAKEQHAKLLLPMIEILLQEADIKIADLDGIVFGRGPGSFTGLRIACSIAKGLAYAHDLPVFAVSSLAAIAYEARLLAENRPILVLVDARMQEMYWAYFEQDVASQPAEWLTAPQEIHIASTTSIVLAGVGYESVVPLLPLGLQQQIKQQVTVFPTAKALLDLASSHLITPVSAQDALPIYLRNNITQRSS